MRTRAFDRIDSFLNGEELDAVFDEINYLSLLCMTSDKNTAIFSLHSKSHRHLNLNGNVCLRILRNCNDLLKVRLFPREIAIPFSEEITVRAVFQHLHSVRWQEQLYAVTILSVFKSMYDKYENPTRRGLLKFLIWDFSNTGDGNSYTLQNPAGQPTILPQETRKSEH
ncbi:hypothetical protein RF11_03126 [Thelohanellus kitauei]|uniref:Uncharacterized protein n=1 Tax=Thelohanellus kitauei TaxID=669202 RepID=A0A0C2NH41_THEKT|nr:hypothetical protein RF11_03126 [Thelohanellus kitauei]